VADERRTESRHHAPWSRGPGQRWRGLAFAAGIAIVAVAGVAALVSRGADREASADDPGATTIYGVWELVELDGEPPVSPATVAFTLEPERPGEFESVAASGLGYLKLRGDDGCRSYGGGYEVVGDRIHGAPIGAGFKDCGEQLEDQSDRFGRVLSSSQWSITDGELILRGDGGTIAVLAEVTSGAAGVWVMTELGGLPASSSSSLTIWPQASWFNGYAGCWIHGEFVAAGSRLMFNGVTSFDAVTTTVPAPPQTSPTDRQNSVSPLFGCETVGDQEHQLLTIMSSAQGLTDGSTLTITNEVGVAATFRRA